MRKSTQQSKKNPQKMSSQLQKEAQPEVEQFYIFLNPSKRLIVRGEEES